MANSKDGGNPKRARGWPRTVAFETGRVRVALRSDGNFALSWREMGETRRTTKTGESNALEWAAGKARELDAGSGRRWVTPADAETLAALRTVAGTGEGAVRRLLDDIRGAREWLDGAADMTTAARWYAEHGPLRVARVTARAAIEGFLGEYETAPAATRRTFGTELRGWLAERGTGADVPLLSLTAAALDVWVRRNSPDGGAPAPRTVRNRITTWVTFLNRARVLGWLPAGRHAADALRKPTIPDAGKTVLTPDQASRLLVAVREKAPKLEAYLLVAGWLGLRPSEIQRLAWDGFEWERGYLHVAVRVAGKTSSERYVPADSRVLRRLREIFVSSGKTRAGKVCGFRSREFLSVLARREGIVTAWPPDVLRHSFCSYRIALVKSLDQVADEAGNSPAILKSNYRKPVREEDGAAWWRVLGAEITPTPTLPES